MHGLADEQDPSTPHGGSVVVVVVGGHDVVGRVLDGADVDGTVDSEAVDVVVVVVDVVIAQPPLAQASQQLSNVPAHALPPRGAVHFSIWLLIAHDVWPPGRVRQQATPRGSPHRERAAHRRTAPAHVGFARTALAAASAHCTYAPRLAAPAQSQAAATAARAWATSLRSGSVAGSQRACTAAGPSPRTSSTAAARPRRCARAVDRLGTT